MKKLLTLLFASVLFTSSFAQGQNRNDDWDDDDNRDNNEEYENRRNKTDRRNNGTYNNNQNSALVVNAFSRNRIKVIIDYSSEYLSNNNNGYNNAVNIGSLLTGNHTVVIYEIKRNFFGNERQEQIYSSVLFFRPSFETIINIDNAGQIAVSERQLFNNNNGGGYYGNGYGYGKKKNKHKHYKKNRGCNNDINNYPNQFPTGGYGTNQQMNDFDFNNMKLFISKESFDNRRLEVAKIAAANNYFSTLQVREIMNVFSFDDGKLELAKYLYARSLDKNNYYQLTNAFSFSTNKDALLEFIKR